MNGKDVFVVGLALLVILLTFALAGPSMPSGFGEDYYGGVSGMPTIFLSPMHLHSNVKNGPFETIFGWILGLFIDKAAEPVVDCAAGPDPCVPPNGVGGGGGGGILPDPTPGGGGGWARKANPWYFFNFKKE